MRRREIDPRFFRHRDLFDAERESGYPLRVAYAGLWSAADREGRFRWVPWELKLDILPYDDLDFSRVLAALAERGFIRQFEVDGKVFGCIPSFLQWQTPHPREAKSRIPAPNDYPGQDMDRPRQALVSPGQEKSAGPSGPSDPQDLRTLKPSDPQGLRVARADGSAGTAGGRGGLDPGQDMDRPRQALVSPGQEKSAGPSGPSDPQDLRTLKPSDPQGLRVARADGSAGTAGGRGGLEPSALARVLEQVPPEYHRDVEQTVRGCARPAALLAECQAMLAGMPGHQSATGDELGRAIRDLAIAGKPPTTRLLASFVRGLTRTDVAIPDAFDRIAAKMEAEGL